MRILKIRKADAPDRDEKIYNILLTRNGKEEIYNKEPLSIKEVEKTIYKLHKDGIRYETFMMVKA